MSANRKRLFEFQKERIEVIVIEARRRCDGEPFVILVLDLLDGFARDIAIAKSNEAEVAAQIELSTTKNVLPCLLLDVPEYDADVLFGQTSGWSIFNSLVHPDVIARVVVVGDKGVSFVTHAVPA